MREMRSIEIDFDVHKAIEAARMSFSETENDVLWRLLKLNGSAGVKLNGPSGAAASAETIGRSWSRKGITLPHGTRLQMQYNGLQHTGVVENGEWVVEGERFKTPSGAAGGVARTKDGKRTTLDGWEYWYVKRPSDTDWIEIRQLLRS